MEEQKSTNQALEETATQYDYPDSEPASEVLAAKEKTSKKKAIVLTVIIAAITLIAIMIFSMFAKHPIEIIAYKIAKANNYQMSAVISDVPLLGSMTIQRKIDGNIEYTPSTLFGDEEYIEIVGDVKYSYTKNDDGNWIKAEITETENSSDNGTSDSTSSESILELLNSKNYEKVKGEKNTYKQKRDVVFDNFEDVVIYIGDNSLTIEMTMTLEKISCEAKVVFSKIGEIELTLPEVE